MGRCSAISSMSIRKDDPNDIVSHENRRVLRALYLFLSWIDYTDSRAVHTLDAIQNVDGVRAIRHYLIDFDHRSAAAVWSRKNRGTDILTPLTCTGDYFP